MLKNITLWIFFGEGFRRISFTTSHNALRLIAAARLLCSSGQIVYQLEGWARDFGGDYLLQMFNRNTVVVTGLPDILRIFALRLTKFSRSNDSVRSACVRHVLLAQEDRFGPLS